MAITEATTLERASAAHTRLLDRLMQLYCYDFSEFSEMPLNSDGTFGNADFIREQLGPNHEQYLIRSGPATAGLAIVTRGSYLTGDPAVTDMAQFFVLRAYRRHRVGERAAIELFRRYPGPWEVRVIRSNAAAQSFWRRTIDAFTTGRYREEDVATDLHDGPVFRFDSSVR